MNEIITQDGEVIEGSALPQGSSMVVQLQKAEIDQQITTARAYPRSLTRVQSAIMSMATLDEESAEECMYALPRGGKPIKGPSVRFAEILKQAYGNCRAAARVVHVDRMEMYVEAEGVFHDLETNSATTARVRRRISDRRGKVFNEDMIIVTGNAACAIAKRNAVLDGVPKPLWRKAYEMVQTAITGDITTLAENREKAFKALAAFGVKPEQVFQALGVEGVDDISVDHIATLRGMYSALKNGEATVEEMFVGTVKPISDHQKIANPLNDEPVRQDAAPAQDRAPDSESTNNQTSNADLLPANDAGGDGPSSSQSVAVDHSASSVSQIPGDAVSEDGASDNSAPDEQPNGSAAAPSSHGISDNDRAWLKMAAKMLLGATSPGGDPDVVRNQYSTILKTLTPAGISQEAIARAGSIGKRCAAVCEGTEELDRNHIAGLALCDVKDFA